MIFLWFTMIFKDSTKINKKEKDKTAFKTPYNRAGEVRWTVLKVEGEVLPGFSVQREKADLHESWER
jgi:hypothetical protein